MSADRSHAEFAVFEVLRHNPTTDPLAALFDLTEFIETAERVRTLTVEHAREAGASWLEIGEQLGITRQAAQQRYGR